DAKSVVTHPSGGQKLAGPGFHEITRIAWTGRGTVSRLEVSTDGGATWKDAALQEPVLPRAHTRFRYAWEWDGSEVTIASRVTDDTGYVPPPRAELGAVRGVNSNYQSNMIQAGKVKADGTVEYAVV